jgi:hypothetical protein
LTTKLSPLGAPNNFTPWFSLSSSIVDESDRVSVLPSADGNGPTDRRLRLDANVIVELQLSCSAEHHLGFVVRQIVAREQTDEGVADTKTPSDLKSLTYSPCAVLSTD